MLAAATLSAQYSMTVNSDRLINAQNEPQNWLMMNGDYGSTRYSKLTQINRDNVKNLRMVWALALGGMQDVGQNGPESEVNPLIDNGFMYTTDGWGTIYKIDARNPNKGEFVWVTDPGVKHQGNVPRTRGIALWEDLVIANLPDGRVIASQPRQRRDRLGQEGRRRPTSSAAGNGSSPRRSPPTAKSSSRTAPATAKTRGWIAALDARTGNELWRWYVVPKPGDPGSETWKDKNNAWKTGGGGIWQTGSYDPATKLTIWGTGNPVPIYDPQARPGDNLYTNSVVALNIDTGKLAWYFQYTPNDSWDYDEVGVHMLYDTTINGQTRKVVGHFGRNGFFYSLDRTNGKFIKAGQYVNDLNWTKGINPEDRQAGRIQPEARRADLQPRSARAARRRHEAHAARRGTAASPTSRPPTTRSRTSPTASASKGASRRTARRSRTCSPDGGIDDKKSEKRTYSSDLYYGSVTAFDAVESQGHRQGGDRHRDPIGRDGHGGRPGVHRAAGRLGRRLQRRDARGAVALQRRHAAERRAGDLRDRTEAVSRRAVRRPPPASGEVRQARELELPVRVRAELDRGYDARR